MGKVLKVIMDMEKRRRMPALTGAEALTFDQWDRAGRRLPALAVPLPSDNFSSSPTTQKLKPKVTRANSDPGPERPKKPEMQRARTVPTQTDPTPIHSIKTPAPSAERINFTDDESGNI